MYDEATLEAALEFLAPYGPDLRNGMTSHAPMAAEALCALGRGDAVLPWLERQRPGLLPRPQPRERIPRAEWQAWLGREERSAEWSALVAEELAEAPWQAVLARWTARLAPGLCAAATHGVIRTAHAARALDRGETPRRREELAAALGYWGATYQTLPTARGGAVAGGAREALARVERIPLAERRFTGTITGSLAALDAHASFAGVIDLFDSRIDADAAIGDLAETFARVLLANAHDPLTAIVFVHGVTSSAALRALVPHLDAATAREALRHAFQAGAALYATFGTQRPVAGEIEPPAEDGDALIERAVASGDEHAIKLVEACLAEHRRSPSPAFLAAAHHGVAMLAR